MEDDDRLSLADFAIIQLSRFNRGMAFAGSRLLGGQISAHTTSLGRVLLTCDALRRPSPRSGDGQKCVARGMPVRASSSPRDRAHPINSLTFTPTACPSLRCSLASRWIPSKRLDAIMPDVSR